MALARLQRAGHKPIAIVGGATGMIGDPSGKSSARKMLSAEEVAVNLEGIAEQLRRFLDFDATPNGAVLLNNADWIREVNIIEFLRDVGRHVPVNTMLGKETVARRLEDGITFTEFSYMLLQAFDFLVLHDRFGCTLQMGGSDQWGNITAGIDLVRRARSATVHGLVFPLLTTARGTKFGKTEAGTVWLDSTRTSPFRFFQFWLGTDDRDVVRLLKFVTWLTEDEIRELEIEVEKNPARREAQRVLAREVTRMVHGDEAVMRAERCAQALFSGDVAELDRDELVLVFGDAPATTIERNAFEGSGIMLADMVHRTGLATSKGDARRLIKGGGVNVNSRRVSDERLVMTMADALHGEFVVLRKGSKEFRLVRFV